jgi:hypothetical protein
MCSGTIAGSMRLQLDGGAYRWCESLISLTRMEVGTPQVGRSPQRWLFDGTPQVFRRRRSISLVRVAHIVNSHGSGDSASRQEPPEMAV